MGLSDVRFVAYMPSRVIKNRLDDPEKAEELFRVLKEADQHKLFAYPEILRDKVLPNATNGDALRKMVENSGYPSQYPKTPALIAKPGRAGAVLLKECAAGSFFAERPESCAADGWSLA